MVIVYLFIYSQQYNKTKNHEDRVVDCYQFTNVTLKTLA